MFFNENQLFVIFFLGVIEVFNCFMPLHLLIVVCAWHKKIKQTKH